MEHPLSHSNLSQMSPFDYSVRSKVQSYNISHNIVLMELCFDAEEQCELKLNEQGQECMYFVYNLESSLLISFENGEKSSLKPFQSAVLYDKNTRTARLQFQSGDAHNLCLLKMIKSKHPEKNGLYHQLEQSFKGLNKQQRFVYIGAANLQICDYIRKLLKLDKESLSNNLMAASYIYMVMSLKLGDYMEALKKPKVVSMLSLKELQHIQKLSDQIIEAPENQYTIEDLCMSSGLTVAKLQQGFKDMHNRTVANFITYIRLVKAEELIKTTDLNISEIVYSIGWTSRSYFCKIFKRHFKCTPKSYKQKIKVAVTA
ncbi:helix-turn-helix transcriptional regulator [Subsaximicrobium wynnwilliamsii]|uniref:Helix-turn-helix transcriptional regulator n=1 Tax=Subsaximicrobium wynnwilliamsii TaxID=291179 RepID=A0A5C6ZID4_9FLAO|nr:AraC family transcriptional regulator [Subsaximicrobium wynnwilliamsii]TXD81559.1 helix-turn-helix transcriptional regulator [Subsaximicrobium wynnwilliamsii]TXD89921.1 helix-turn-helix transcriptional regulator [Subsaximicrobium wynnwilliamsii]TXE01020.1 helix-turn-helix transcriptional regulator [Subsaximicrobium wynnwilliamsii]